MNNQEIAKYRKKKNSSSKSEKKADHKHEYQYCIVVYTYNWSDRYYAHRRQYCSICGKIHTHRGLMDSLNDCREDMGVDGDESNLREKYPELPVFHLQHYSDDYVNLQESQVERK